MQKRSAAKQHLPDFFCKLVGVVPDTFRELLPAPILRGYLTDVFLGDKCETVENAFVRRRREVLHRRFRLWHFVEAELYRLGDRLIENCGSRFTADEVGLQSRRGGCNPYPITDENRTVTDTEIEIPYDFLKASKGIFAER